MSTKRSLWTRLAQLGLAGTLALVLTGDRGRAAGGIDPLEILKLQVRPNALVVLDSSGSMKERPDCFNGCDNFNEAETVGDDPTAKLYQAKQVLKSIIQKNQTKVSFQFGKYTQVSNFPSGDFIYSKICDDSDTTCRSDANAISISTPSVGVVISEFRTRGPNGLDDEFVEVYNASSTQVDIGDWRLRSSTSTGTTSLRATIPTGTVLDPGCHYLITNSTYSGSVAGDQGYTSGGSIPGNGGLAIVDDNNNVVDEVGMNNGSTYLEGTRLTALSGSTDDGYERKPGGAAGSGFDSNDNNIDFQLLAPSAPQNSTSACLIAATGLRRSPGSDFLDTPAPTTQKVYYLHLSTDQFYNGQTVKVQSNGQVGGVSAGSKTNPATVTVQMVNASGANVGTAVTFTFRGIAWGPNGNDSCGGFESLVGLAPCDNNAQFGAISPFLENELLLDGSGDIQGFVAGQPPTFTPGGIHAAGFTPIAESLMDIQTEFTNNIFPNRPNARQRTFVIFVTDGDDTCSNENTFDNSNPNDLALRAAFRAQKLYEQDVAGDPTSSVPVFVIAYGTGASANRSNWIAWGGSGMVRSTILSGDDTRWDPAPTAADFAACPTCINAFSAATQAQLEAALQAAIDQGASSGHFSDTQSVTDSIFEFVNLAGAFDPMDPDTRYSSTLPILIQATFEMPGFLGHLKAFRNSNDGTDTSVLIWDAADALCRQVTGNLATTLPVPQNNSCSGAAWTTTSALKGAMGTGTTNFTFAQTVTNIKRRIYTTTRNGVNAEYTVDNLINVNANLRDEGGTLPMAPLWPPSAAVDPAKSGTSYPAGSLDTALGFTGLTFADLQLQYGACVRSTDAGNGPLPTSGDCSVTTGSPARQLELARKEAREMILAFTAGARVALGTDGRPLRDAGGNIFYRARTWMLAESTLAAPAVLSPPDFRSRAKDHPNEFNVLRTGPRTATNYATDGLEAGFGLTEPDLDNDPTNAAANSTTIKPVMSVVYYGTNHMLHAFRAGACPAGVASCIDETGGEELWAFVPFDQLAKLRSRMLPQQIQNHTYVIATPVRFAQVFVPGSFSKSFGGANVSGDGVWRVVLVVGRGAGGKYLTTLDVTAPGPFTRSAGLALPPIVVWNRGNPDTNDGLVKTGSNTYNNIVGDYTAYLGMGETWSVPAVGFVTAANNTTARKSQGVEFVAWVGSGFSDVPTEGHRFYALDVLTGDVIASHDVGSGTSVAGIQNAIVAGPAAFAGNNPNITTLTTAVYFADIHSRIFKFNPDSPGTAPALFRDLSGDQDQPIANGLSVFEANSDGSGNKPHILVEAGNDSRVPSRSASPRFRLYALRDANGTAEDVFAPIDFPDGFRGTASPTATFDTDGELAFFVGTKFNPPGSTCESSFDSVLFALNAKTGGAAYDLNDASATQDLYATLTNQRITSTSVAFGRTVVDMGLGVDQPPPPPAPPDTQTQGTLSAAVSVGSALPGSTNWRVGSTVCR